MPITDYETEQDQIKRAMADAAALRADNATPQGQMVGGHFVAPSWTQQLAPVLSQVMGGYKQSQAEAQQKALTGKVQSDYTNWMQQRPQAQTTTTTENAPIPGTEAPGPMPEDQQGQILPKTMQTMKTQTTQPTRDQQMAWAGQGLQNPLSKTLAEKYMEDQMIAQPDREQQQQWKASESALQRQNRLQQIHDTYTNRFAEIQVKLADHRLDEGQKAELFKQADATKRAIAAVEAQSRVDAAHERMLAAGSKVSPVPPTVVSKMTDAEQIANNISGAYTSFDPKFAGPTGAIQSFVGKVSPWSSDEQQQAANWWNNYENTVALVERHTKFGSAFTATEKKAWDNATFSKLSPPEIIAKNLQTRAQVAAHYFNRLRSGYTQTGHPQVGEAFQELPEDFEAAPGQSPQATQPVVKTMQPAGQSRRKSDLPAGVTIGPALPD